MTPTVDLMTGKEIPDDLAGIGGTVRGHQPLALNESYLVITGLPGTGKSSLLNANPNCFVIDLERGGRTVQSPNAVRWPNPEVMPNPGWSDIKDVCSELCRRKNAGKLSSVECIGFDTYDALLDLVMVDFCQRHSLAHIGDYMSGGKGYYLVREEIDSLFDTIMGAGLGVHILMHVRDKIIKNGLDQTVVVELAVSDSFRAAIFRRCEHMLFLESDEDIQKVPVLKTIKGVEKAVGSQTVKVPIRRCRVAPGDIRSGAYANQAKCRVPFESNFLIPPVNGWAALEEKFQEAVDKLTSQA